MLNEIYRKIGFVQHFLFCLLTIYYIKLNTFLQKYMKTLRKYILSEAVKAENGEPWEVYVSNKLDDNFTEWAKNWKKKPQVGKGWYAGGTIFKVVKIEDNKVYTEPDC